MRITEVKCWYQITILLVTIFMLASCVPASPTNIEPYRGIVTVTKVNGNVSMVEVVFPEYNFRYNNGNCYTHLRVWQRNDLEKLLVNMKTMVVDLETAQQQMKVIEPPIESVVKPLENK